MHSHPCYICGRKPAEGYASVYQDGKERWFCHGDDDPPERMTCYERAQGEARLHALRSADKGR